MPITSFLIPLDSRQEGPHELLERILKIHTPSLPDAERAELVTEIAALFTTLTNTMGIIGWSEGVKDFDKKQKSTPDSVKKTLEAKDVLIEQLRSEVAFLRDVIRRGQENAGQTPDDPVTLYAQDPDPVPGAHEPPDTGTSQASPGKNDNENDG
jgi:hypothetical protein